MWLKGMEGIGNRERERVEIGFGSMESVVHRSGAV